jgi:hypothetical protein
MSEQWYCPIHGPIADTWVSRISMERHCKKCDTPVADDMPPFVTAMQEEISALRAAAIQPVMSRQGFGTPGTIEFYRCVFCNHDARTPDIAHDSDCVVREAGYLKEEG